MKCFAVTIVLCLLSVVWVTGNQAQASPIRFDLFNDSHFNSSHDSLEFNRSGIGVRVFAFDEDGRQSVTIRKTGLGVTSSGDSNKVLDGSGRTESLHFLFTDAVWLREVVFESVDDDGFTLSVDGVGDYGMLNLPTDGIADLELLGSRFGFGVTKKGDDYRIKSMLVELAAVPTPEPATWLLLGSGLAGVWFYRRRA